MDNNEKPSELTAKDAREIVDNFDVSAYVDEMVNKTLEEIKHLAGKTITQYPVQFFKFQKEIEEKLRSLGYKVTNDSAVDNMGWTTVSW